MPFTAHTTSTKRKRVFRSNMALLHQAWRQTELVHGHEERNSRHRHPERRDRSKRQRWHDRRRNVGDGTRQPVGQTAKPAIDVVRGVWWQEDRKHETADQRPEQQRKRVVREMKVPVGPPEVFALHCCYPLRVETPRTLT